MGIENGAGDIVSLLEHGLYNTNPKTYNIYIDGELLRYKGMIHDNLYRRDAEEAIAATSYQYLLSLCSKIQVMITNDHESRVDCLPNIIVFMDSSARVANKKTRLATTGLPNLLDLSLVRNLFVAYCNKHGKQISVVILNKGESELAMYLHRDKDSPLNVFVTNDSDFVSIAYDHRPMCANTATLNDIRILDTQSKDIVNSNFVYRNDFVGIKDSCLWVKCCSNQPSRAYGMDFNFRLFRMNSKIFRLFVSLCGTDFTNNLLTSSMVKNIVGYLKKNVSDKFVEKIAMVQQARSIDPSCSLLREPILDDENSRANNTMRYFGSSAADKIDVEECAIMLMSLALGANEQKNVTVKRFQRQSMDVCEKSYSQQISSLETQFLVYENYIRTGIMKTDKIMIAPDTGMIGKIWLDFLWGALQQQRQHGICRKKFSLKSLREKLRDRVDRLEESVALYLRVNGGIATFLRHRI